eukprot:13740836-Alexandrium_andersonii.AAC.1
MWTMFVEPSQNRYAAGVAVADPPPAIISPLRTRDRISNEASPPKPHVQKRYSTYLMTLNGDGYYDIHIYCIDNQNMEIS